MLHEEIQDWFLSLPPIPAKTSPIKELSSTLRAIGPNSHRTEEYLKTWLSGVVGGAFYDPNTTMLILESQSPTVHKSAFFKYLTPKREWLTLGDGSQKEEIYDYLIVCNDECRNFMQMRQLVSQQSFKIRQPYERVAEPIKRLSSFCGTTNFHSQNKSHSFLVINLENITPCPVPKELIWAEALAIYRKKERTNGAPIHPKLV